LPKFFIFNGGNFNSGLRLGLPKRHY